MNIMYFSLIACLLACLAMPAPAAESPASAPQIAARAYILQDFHSGRILLEHNADQRSDPASLTKLMTAYVVFTELHAKRLTPETQVTVSEKAWRMEGSRMYIEVGTQVAVRDLLKGMIIQSGNDASVALAELVAGSEEAFASLMNKQAERLGMSNTHYINSTGMPSEQHYSTARDLATITRALIRDYPEYYKLYSEREYSYNNITQPNRNLLLSRDPTVDGVKTGYTEAAGYCLISSARRDNMRLVSVILGTSGPKVRAEESQKLLNYGFRFYETHRLYAARQVLSNERVWKGEAESVPVGLALPLHVTIPRGQYSQLRASLKIEQRLVAPVQKDARVGLLRVRFKDKLLVEKPVVALRNVATGSWFRQGLDYLLLQFE